MAIKPNEGAQANATPNFDWRDPLMFESQLVEEERQIRDSARSYAQGELLPRVTSAYLEKRFDREIMTEMGTIGLLGATMPERYGGSAQLLRDVVRAS